MGLSGCSSTAGEPVAEAKNEEGDGGNQRGSARVDGESGGGSGEEDPLEGKAEEEGQDRGGTPLGGGGGGEAGVPEIGGLPGSAEKGGEGDGEEVDTEAGPHGRKRKLVGEQGHDATEELGEGDRGRRQRRWIAMGEAEVEGAAT